MTITDIAKEEAEKYVKEHTEIIEDEELGLIYHKEPSATEAFEVAYMLGYNRGRAEELSKGDFE